MTAHRVPLTALDLAVIPVGSTAREAIASSIERAVVAEEAGFAGYWLAEHHLTAGLASVSPLPILAAAAARTRRIRIGSGATLTGHRTAVGIAEDFATLAALAPGRIDLGLGRSGGRGRGPASTAPETQRVVSSDRFTRATLALQQRDALAAPHADVVAEVAALLRDDHVDVGGSRWSVLPGGAPDVELWLLGSSPGESAEAAATLGLPFAVNNHMRPAEAFQAVRHYRERFIASAAHPSPRVAVAAEVFTAPTGAAAHSLAEAHLGWVLDQRLGHGILPFPAPERAPVTRAPDERRLLADRESALVVGTPPEAVERLGALVERFAADELIVTTSAHDPADHAWVLRALAAEWGVSGSSGH